VITFSTEENPSSAQFVKQHYHIGQQTYFMYMICRLSKAIKLVYEYHEKNFLIDLHCDQFSYGYNIMVTFKIFLRTYVGTRDHDNNTCIINSL